MVRVNAAMRMRRYSMHYVRPNLCEYILCYMSLTAVQISKYLYQIYMFGSTPMYSPVAKCQKHNHLDISIYPVLAY